MRRQSSLKELHLHFVLPSFSFLHFLRQLYNVGAQRTVTFASSCSLQEAWRHLVCYSSPSSLAAARFLSINAVHLLQRYWWYAHSYGALFGPHTLLTYALLIGLAQTPESSPKVLLKISAKPPVSKDYTFQFTSAKNIQERESIKAQIAELLARVRGLSSSSAVGTPAPITPSSVVASPSPSTPQTATASPAPPSLQQQAAANIRPSTPLNNTPSPSANGASPKSWRQEEFADRRALLTSSKELQTLHKELVVVGRSVDEEEFWSSPYVKRIRQVKEQLCVCVGQCDVRYSCGLSLQKLKKDAVSREGRQKGKSSRMVELKPGQQEGSDIKYTLTSQIIHNIFTEFPSGRCEKGGHQGYDADENWLVKRAYDTNVPDKVETFKSREMDTQTDTRIPFRWQSNHFGNDSSHQNSSTDLVQVADLSWRLTMTFSIAVCRKKMMVINGYMHVLLPNALTWAQYRKLQTTTHVSHGQDSLWFGSVCHSWGSYREWKCAWFHNEGWQRSAVAAFDSSIQQAFIQSAWNSTVVRLWTALALSQSH